MMDELEFKKTFFRTKHSLSVLINLLRSSTRSYVVFKPSILFTSNERATLENIKEKLTLSTNITVTKKSKFRGNVRYDLHVQRFAEIKRVCNDYFVGNVDGEQLKLFLALVNHIEKMGYIQREWNDDFRKVIKYKLLLNKHDVRRRKKFSLEEWEERIKKHLENGEA
jgi:hypothetical protein